MRSLEADSQDEISLHQGCPYCNNVNPFQCNIRIANTDSQFAKHCSTGCAETQNSWEFHSLAKRIFCLRSMCSK